jgi:hypothetical protein
MVAKRNAFAANYGLSRDVTRDFSLTQAAELSKEGGQARLREGVRDMCVSV